MEKYLFENAKEFSYADISLIIAIALMLVFVFSSLYFKKRRDGLDVSVENRKKILFHSKIALVLSLVNLIYVVGRVLDIDFLRYRIIGWSCLVLILADVLVLGVRLLAFKNKVKKGVAKKGSSYGDYLPKKKRK